MGSLVEDGPIRVLIADDYAPMRRGLRTELEEAGFSICAAEADAAGAIGSALRERPDLCLLDVRMPGSGIDAAWEITERLPGSKVVMLTVSAQPEDVWASLRAGACGYLRKEGDYDLPAVLRWIVAGAMVIPAVGVARLRAELGGQSARRSAASEAGYERTRESERILALARLDMPTAELGRRLEMPEDLVRAALAGIMSSVRAPDRDALVAHPALS